MTSEIQIYIVTMLAVGTAGVVAITLLTLKIIRKTTPDASARLKHFHRKFPELAALPEVEQRSILRRASILPIALAMIALIGFYWIALGTPAVLDFINASPRAAGLVGCGLLVVLLPLVIVCQSVLIRRHLRHLQP
jgi:hypothetical protein